MKPMKTSAAILFGIAISLLTLGISAFQNEKGDINAISMYFVVFLIPILLLNLLNGLILKIASKQRRLIYKRALSIFPFLICISLILSQNLKLSFIDGSISFLGIIGAFTIGLVNLIWNLKLPKS